MVTSEGYVVGEGITIPPEASPINIAGGHDGTISATVPGDPPSRTAARPAPARHLRQPGRPRGRRRHPVQGHRRLGGDAIVGPPGSDGAGSLLQGAVEQSNVNVVEEMIDLIAGQRAYEVNTRVIKAADEMLGHRDPDEV